MAKLQTLKEWLAVHDGHLYERHVILAVKATIEAVICDNLQDLDGDSSTFTIGYNEAISDVKQRAKKWLEENHD